MYGNVTDFCMLILYPATALNLFNSFFPLVGSLGFIYIRSCHLQTETILFLPFWLCVRVLSHVWLCDLMDSVHRIFQARILKWVAIPSSRRPSWPRIEPVSPALLAVSLLLRHQGSPSFLIGCLLFLFLAWLLWLGFPRFCWIGVMRVDVGGGQS